ncbi:flagella synthesis protein FlgN [Saccharophagus degradans]|uniref:FlgN n=1 Tax=Saccharophagus degradans (strain 2-40 / ATCC 43961 / DSM 17024) TaxID=203122 RepID=Q21IK1_SACD2|nr:flagellar protein FlgN [Saccharophagus degradans]ABD81478.1 FlgN [Saccharophagus degradans 2-40]
MSVTPQAIQGQIVADIKACESLLTLFESEREALKIRDSDALEAILQNKNACIQILENSAKQRAIWSQQAAQNDPENGWDTLIESLSHTQVKEQWGTLKELFKRCKEENEINGRLVARNQQVFGRLIEILRGQTNAPNLYNAKGSASSNAGSNRFGEA